MKTALFVMLYTMLAILLAGCFIPAGAALYTSVQIPTFSTEWVMMIIISSCFLMMGLTIAASATAIYCSWKGHAWVDRVFWSKSKRPAQ